MVLKVGKIYLDSLGRKVKILKKIRGTEFCFIGERLSNGEMSRFKENGQFAYMKTPYCLIEELKG